MTFYSITQGYSNQNYKTTEIFINISNFLKFQISQSVKLPAFLYKILKCFCSLGLVSFVFFVL